MTIPSPTPTRPAAAGGRDFDALFDPRVVALVGASAAPTKWGHLLARNLLTGTDRRTVHLVSRSGGEILGHPVHRSLADLPERPDLVVVVVPVASVEQTVEDALAAGARAIVVITVGYRESGPEGAARERALADRVRAAGALLVGPNCNGVWNGAVQLDAMTWLDDPQTGSLAVVSQSGGIITELVSLGPRHDVGFSRLLSFGNQADVDAAELVRALTHDPATKVIAAYVEEFRDGRAFLEAAAEAIAAGKPVVLLAPPSSDPTRRAVASHTGSLLADDVARRAACRAVGIVQVETPPQLIEAVEALRARRAPRGPRVGVIADGGGQAVLGAGAAVARGLDVPGFSDDLERAIADATAGASARRNPVDITGGSHFELSDYADAVRVVAASGEVDAVVLTSMFGGYERQSVAYVADELAAAEALTTVAEDTGVPVVVHTWYGDTPGAQVLRAGGVPVFEDVGTALDAVVLLRDREDVHGLPAVAGRAEAPGDVATRGVLPADLPDAETFGDEPAGARPAAARPSIGGPRPATTPAGRAAYWRDRRVVEAAGIPVAAARPASTPDDAVLAADALGYPVVLKVLGRAHKSDDGGVVLDVASAAAVRAAAERLLGDRPGAELAVEAQAPLRDGVELLVGVRRDPSFGPLVVVGAGGLHAELHQDVAVALAPVDAARGERLVRSLRIAPLLAGARGRPVLDVAAAGRAVAALSAALDGPGSPDELEVNPLLVLPAGVLALDAHAVRPRDAADREAADRERPATATATATHAPASRTDTAVGVSPAPAAAAAGRAALPPADPAPLPPTTVGALVREARAAVRGLSPDDLRRELEERRPVLIDVRDVRERWKEGAIPGATHVPRGMLEFWADPTSEYHRAELDPERPVVAYCAGGWRSALAAVTLQRLGYRDVAHLDPGFSGWKAEGGAWEPVRR
ncbi:acetate--CoA ligase family protein [Patulibacter sp. NPDC049589]|uniref:acetate--CoA ligase family protein n=1 Tax=Patulibacter sp. NPDC049589 TaxID=3154731 RepID=UPI003430D1AE